MLTINVRFFQFLLNSIVAHRYCSFYYHYPSVDRVFSCLKFNFSFVRSWSSIHYHLVRLVLRNILNNLFFIANGILLFINTSLRFWKAFFVIPMGLLVSMSHFSSSIKTLARYLNYRTCLILVSPISNFHVGLPLLHTSMHSVFLQLMSSPFFTVSYTTFWKNYCNVLHVSVINYVSSTYLIF